MQKNEKTKISVVQLANFMLKNLNDYQMIFPPYMKNEPKMSKKHRRKKPYVEASNRCAQ